MAMNDDIDFEALQEEILSALNDEAEARDQKHPAQLPIFPLLRRPFFPGMATPLIIDKGPYYEALQAIAKKKQKFIVLVLTKNETQDLSNLKAEDLYSVGVLARILRIIPSHMGDSAQIVVSIDKRIRLEKVSKKGRPLMGKVAIIEDATTPSPNLKASSISIVTTIKELLKLNPLFKEELQVFLSHSDFTEPSKLADFAVALTTASREELQEVLETFDIQQRIDKTLVLLRKEIDLSLLQHDIHKKIENSVGKHQRDYFLREQLKTIKKELGLEKDEKSLDNAKFEERLKNKTVPEAAMKVIREEMEKLAALEPAASEYGICRNYLDWLTNIPWGVLTKDNLDLKHAHQVLEEDHFGLKEIKERILEFISVGTLTGGVKGSIICLVGPPGVGKTSVAKSIAKALGRKFFHFSVGGMRDEGEIKGHRRTYVGAMPGKLIQALKTTGSSNPVILIDEIDKMGVSHQGDPASALLEVLDPEHNKEFTDYYLDVPCDLSQVLFIVTANLLDPIPEPLRDRMEILRMSGYIQEEKAAITTRYLWPKQLTEAGLKKSDVTLSPKALAILIDSYARESGLRSLENAIKKILRKAARLLVEHKKKSRITPQTLLDFLGKPPFSSDMFYTKPPVGVATGLAWTAMGGATLFIEAIEAPGEKNTLHLTGQAGDVMKESSQIAWSYVQAQNFVPFFDKKSVHLHLPEGAVPKDGPSAGITMVSALLSLLLKKPLPPHVAMTGEITLTGKVLPVGGIKEKFIAARRSAIKTIILPKDNQKDLDELPAEIKKGLKFIMVGDYKQVFKAVFS